MQKFDFPYRKSINVTAWVLQLLVSVLALGIGAWLLSYWDSVRNQYDWEGKQGLITTAFALQVVLAGITIVLDIAEIVLFAKSRLLPALYLTSTTIKTLIWGIVFILSVVSVSIISLILCGILFITALIQMIYAAKIVHKKRRGTLYSGNYRPADASGEADLGMAPRGSYAAYNPQPPINTAYNGAPHGTATEYYAQPEGIVHANK